MTKQELATVLKLTPEWQEFMKCYDARSAAFNLVSECEKALDEKRKAMEATHEHQAWERKAQDD